MTTLSTLATSPYRPRIRLEAAVTGLDRAIPRKGLKSTGTSPDVQTASMFETERFEVAVGTVSSRNIPTSALTNDTPPTISIG